MTNRRIDSGVINGRGHPVGIALENPGETVRRGRRQRTPPTRQHLEQHAAERPDIGPFVDRAARLFGAHVRRRAEDEPRACSRGGHIRLLDVDDLPDAEVEHLDLPRRRNLDVRGFQIAVDDPPFMGRFESGRDLSGDGQGPP